ncbi:MAG TPA: DUF4214 domain-containing protein, partial [Noviherbaspirillum sp.]|nr:DUF4214 domain-containing protein [Noviherbaspirillum sp.]
DYDNAGRVWRTNGGDGVDKIMLHGIEGHVTAEIRSADRQLKSAQYDSADDVVGLDKVLRTETRYDLMGRAIAQASPTRYESVVANSLQSAFVSANVISRARNELMLSYNGEGSERAWTGVNEVKLQWMSFAGWGGGDVKVELEYTSNPVILTTREGGVTEYQVLAPAETASYTQIFNAGQAVDGVTLNWKGDTADRPDFHNAPGVDNIKRIAVWKKDIKGEWVKVIDQATPGTFSSFVRVQAPADPEMQVSLQYRVAGTNGAFLAAPLSNFGDTLVFDTIALVEGNYEYQVIHQRAGQSAAVHDQGTLTVASKDVLLIRKQIAQAYVLLFNRGPELAGLNLWTEEVRAGRSLASVLQSLLQSQEAMDRYPEGMSGYQIMDKIYTDVLGLQPAGHDWAAQLQNRPKGEVLVELINWITSYSGADGLAPDAKRLFSNKVDVGLTYAVQLSGNRGEEARRITQLVTAADTSAAIAAAQESVARLQRLTQITQLYVALLNRAPDKGGLDTWLNAMNNGMSWEDVGNGILNGQEARNAPLHLDAMSDTEFVTHLYKTVLNRAPDAAGLQSWASHLTGAPGVAPISRGLLAAQMANATSSYKGLGALELSEKKLFNNKVAIGLSYAQDLEQNDAAIARAVIAAATDASSAREAAEAAKAVTAAAAAFAETAANASSAAAQATPLEKRRMQVAQLYIALLNRAPEYPGMTHWVEYMESPHSMAEVATEILNSAEAKDPALYPNGMSDEQFIQKVYQLVLNRNAEAAAVAFRKQELLGSATQAPMSRGELVAAIINGFLNDPRPDAGEKARQDLFNNKVAVGLTYSLYLKGDDVDAEREIISLVTASDTSAAVAAALAAVKLKAAAGAAEIAESTASAASSTEAAGNAVENAVDTEQTAATAAASAANVATAVDRIELAQLYATILNRAPELAGLNFQAQEMQKGLSLITVADNMLASEEAKQVGWYPSSLSNEQFVAQVYLRVLGRPVDAIGAELRLQQLAQGMSRGQVLLEVIHGFVNYAGTGAEELALKAAFNKK